MTLAQVQAAVALVVALIFSLAGLLTTVALLLPRQTDRASAALSSRPWRCLGGGLGVLVALAIAGVMVALPNPLVKLVGAVLLGFGSAVVTVGAAGVVQLIGQRISDRTGEAIGFGTLTKAGMAYSLAAFFPVLGWYVFAPVSAICALGAGMAAVWPERRVVVPPPVVAAAGSVSSGTGAQ